MKAIKMALVFMSQVYKYPRGGHLTHRPTGGLSDIFGSNAYPK